MIPDITAAIAGHAGGTEVAIHHLNQEATVARLRACCAPRLARPSRSGSKTLSVVEVMLNPDGRLWIDRLAGGPRRYRKSVYRLGMARRIVRLVAHHVGAEVHPRLAKGYRPKLPESGERFEGLLPPVVAAPAFAIRKPRGRRVHPRRLCRRRHHERGGKARKHCARPSRTARNILVAGRPPPPARTTLTNALLAEVAKTADRVVLIEDTRELQCKAPNLVALRTKGRASPRCPISFDRLFACAPIAFRSVKSEALKRSIS